MVRTQANFPHTLPSQIKKVKNSTRELFIKKEHCRQELGLRIGTCSDNIITIQSLYKNKTIKGNVGSTEI